ncbi:MAG: oxidoreductase [Bacteroidota bacterium]|nr:oxidoreductase [Bacteroidota bacterium]
MAEAANLGKVILITGASSGMGREAAILLARGGHTVYAGARRAERMEDLSEHGITPVQMDVSKGEDNERAVREIINAKGRIDVLINNAGFGLYGTVEDIPLEDARYQFEVNLFGIAHLTQLVLPHMRAQRSGRIVNVSSMGGRIYTPLGAWYHATKHALEGWSDCLRVETAPFNIQVVVIQPGAIRTEFGDVMGSRLRKYSEDTAYKAQVDSLLRLMDNLEPGTRGTAPEVLGKVFVKAATARKPRRRYVSGSMARPLMFLRKWFGDGVYEFMLLRMFR